MNSVDELEAAEQALFERIGRDPEVLALVYRLLCAAFDAAYQTGLAVGRRGPLQPEVPK